MQQIQVKVDNNATSKSNDCKEFFISEYTDGPQKNKVIEIFNPSDSVKSLNGYSIKIFNNGAPTPLDIPLSGNVNPKETFVVAHPQADQQILLKADQTDVKMNFDGNDAIVLNKGTSTYIDKIGEIGVNPGQAGWNIPPGASTKQHDLRRKQPIDQGETDWNQGKNQWDAFPQDSLGNIKQHQNTCSSILLTNDLSFSFDNVMETGTSPRYLEFDVMVEANNNSTYFDNCLLRIQYNPTAFGSNVVANNKVTITKGTTYNSLTYIDPDANAIDQTTSVMGVPFGTDFNQSSWNRTLVTTTPTQILHFKIEIASCNQNSTIDFTDIAFTPNFSFYAVNANDNIVNTLSYDNTSYLNSINEVLCELKIINFFPNPITAGTNSVLTIQGQNFGASRGTGQVWFKNADDGGATFIEHQDYIDYVSWSDTEIKIKVPSYVDTLQTKKPSAGSGQIGVVTNSNDFILSTNNLSIDYSIRNTLVAGQKIRYNLIDPTPNNLDTGIIFLVDTSISNNPLIYEVVKKAVHDWSCTTAINWKIKGDTVKQGLVQDGVSLIYLDDNFHGKPLGRFLGQNPSVCTDLNTNNLVVFFREYDLAMSRDLDSVAATGWMYDTTLTQNLPPNTVDFYAVTAHELGHGHALDHVINANDLMFFAAQTGFVSVINRLNIFSSPNAIDGGLDVMSVSTGLNLNNCASASEMIPLILEDCTGGTIGLAELFKSYGKIFTYPNPTNDNGFFVAYELKRNATIEFILLDYTGREVNRIGKVKKPKGQYTQQIQMNNLTSGLYFFIANIDGKIQTLKVIKQ
ncbi:MAG: lamin tail domain-containing protein [Vicingaceae bacterium]|nr:lamin tail domain-containing protein [Vicingaceae bacterium]